MSIQKTFFDTFGGKNVYAYTMTNRKGASVSVLTYGATLHRVCMPDRNGVLADVVCGFDRIADYCVGRGSYSGVTVGRYANRISDGGFTLNGTFYPLPRNETGRGHLHGGHVGFHRRLWDAEAIEGETGDSVVLTLFTPHLEDGYPGDLYVKATYTLDDENVLTVHYEAVTDRDTILNMTNHAYFNLNGYDGGSGLEQQLCLHADTYDEVNELLIPDGEPRSVEGTRYDFRTMRPIGESYDHNFQVRGQVGELRIAAEAYDPRSGRTMDVYTDLPAIQLYTADAMGGPVRLKGGVEQKPCHAYCLETQYSPDTPHRPYLPSCVITPEKGYSSVTKFVFGVR